MNTKFRNNSEKTDRSIRPRPRPGGTRWPRDSGRHSSDKRILPLINIVFLLLIFFMLAGRLAYHDPFRIRPPRSASGLVADGHELVVLVAADGRLGLNGEVLTPAGLTSRLARRLSRDGVVDVNLLADGRADADRVLSVLELLRESGVDKLRLLTSSGNR